MSANSQITENGEVIHQPGVTAGAITEVLSSVGEVKSAIESIKSEQVNSAQINLEVAKALAGVTELTSKAVAAIEEDRIQRSEAERYEALTADKYVKSFHDFSAEEQADIRRGLALDYGAKNTEIGLSKSFIKKALLRPITANNPNFDDIKAMRKASDLANRYVAMNGGMLDSRTSSDVVLRDEKMFQEALDKIAKEDAELAHGVELLRSKGINDALDTQTATEGLEWVPTLWSADLVEKMYYELRVASLFPRISMPSKNFRRPVQTAKVNAYRMPENTSNTFFQVLATDHTPETGFVEWSAEKLAVLQFFSDELEQDSIVPILQLANNEAAYGLALGIENACVNGDIVTTTGHMDTTWWSGTTDSRGMWDGFRKRCIGTGALTLNFGGAITLSLLRDLRKKAKEYNDIEKLVWIVAPETAVELLKLPEVVTIDKFGSAATVLRGQIGALDNIPIVVSGQMPTTLTSAGVWGAAGTLTSIALVHRDAWVFGDRQLTRVESDRNALAGSRFVLSTWRGDFQCVYPASEPCTLVGFNVPV